MDVKEILLEMRKYRMGLIQTPEQLKFSYQAIIEGAKQLSNPESNVNEVIIFFSTPHYYPINSFFTLTLLRHLGEFNIQ